jgi:hypothetical protein
VLVFGVVVEAVGGWLWEVEKEVEEEVVYLS